MRKLLSLTLMAVILLSMLMLTSCDAIKDLFGIGGEEPPVQKRTTITEIEWRKVYASKNYTLMVDADGIKFDLAVTDTAADIYADIGLGGQSIKLDAKIDLTNGALITNSESGYMGAVIGQELIGETELTLGEIGILPEIEYSDLAYNEETKTYNGKNETMMYEFRFEEGNLIYALFIPVDVDEKGQIELSNVGTTFVELPEYINITDGKVEPSQAGADVVTTVTEEQLSNPSYMENFTIKADVLIYQMYGKVTENSFEMKLTMMGNVMTESYQTIIDGIVYDISEMYIDGEYRYIASPTDQTTDSMLGDLEDIMECFKFENLTYNKDGRYYELEIEKTKYYLYFENGELVQFVMLGDFMGSGMEMEIIFKLTDIGTTVVELPEYEFKKEELEYFLNSNGTGYLVTGIGQYKGTDVVIPDTHNGIPVVGIAMDAFAYENITSVVIPDTVTKIDNYAFYACEQLKSVTLPDTLIHVGEYAFYDCTSLTSIEIPASVEYMGYGVFAYCKNITVYCESGYQPAAWDEMWHFLWLDAELGSEICVPVYFAGVKLPDEPVPDNDPYTVTKDVWNSNMTMTNYTANVWTNNGTIVMIWQSGDVFLQELVLEGEIIREYEVCIDGVVYCVTKQNDKWVGRVEEMEKMPNWTYTISSIITDRSYFEYDNDRQSYVSSNGTFEYVAAFENDVLVSYEISVIQTGATIMTLKFSEVGTTESVDVPEFNVVE